jgi:threonine/homoserine/homoserine lactone efflux protein
MRGYLAFGGFWVLFLALSTFLSHRVPNLFEEPAMRRYRPLFRGWLAVIINSLTIIFWFVVGAPIFLVTSLTSRWIFLMTYFAVSYGSRLLVAMDGHRQVRRFSDRAHRDTLTVTSVLLVGIAGWLFWSAA